LNIASFSIKRAILIASIVLMIMIVGLISLNSLGVDLFPNVELPFVAVTTIYPGASSEEIENLVSKPMEEELSSISGLKKLSSHNLEGVSIIWAQFTLETDFKYAEQQMRDKIAKIRAKLPEDIDEPLFQRYDPSSSPVLKLSLQADLPPMKIYDIAKEIVKPKIEQVDDVGYVAIIGGTRREIQVELDRKKLNALEIPAIMVANQLKNAGANIPVGKYGEGRSETVYRTLGQFEALDQIENSVVWFSGDIANSIPLKSLGTVKDGTEDPTTLAYLYYPDRDENYKIKGSTEIKPCLYLDIYKQSGTNTVAVVDSVLMSIGSINESLKDYNGSPRLTKVFDASKPIRSSIEDVKFTIILGIILAVLVVYFFLGNIRSTLITGIAIPNSLLGAFILMYIMGFTVNLLNLMALSLTVGLLIDDAIVVRENIFRKLESGMRSFRAAEIGTREVMLAVIATTMTIIAVFFPIGFLRGMVGRFFKEFGFTVVFAMMISLFDALTVAPLLSGYFAGKPAKAKNIFVTKFDEFQNWLERIYGLIMRYTLDRPIRIILVCTAVFILSLVSSLFIKKTFYPEPNFGEFIVEIETPPDTSLEGTLDTVKKIYTKIIRQVPELNYMAITVGNDQNESNMAKLEIFLVPPGHRKYDTSQMKTKFRKILEEFSYAKPRVNDIVLVGEEYPFILNLKGEDLVQLEDYSLKVMKTLRKVPDLIEINTSHQSGKPEFNISLDSMKMQRLGVMPRMAGGELRLQVAGSVVGKLHQSGLEYDIRMRLKPEQRNLKSAFAETRIPNMHMRMIPLTQIASGSMKNGSAKLYRENRYRVIRLFANLVPGGAIDNAMQTADALIKKEIPPPKGVSYDFAGQAEDFRDLSENMLLAFILSIIFIFFVLASLYESFITPATILMALPPAISGALIGLLLTGEMLNMFSMIGVIMLMGLVTKNSILLVDFALEGVRSGMTRKEAIYKAGMLRLRPILMTTMAMIAGTFPLALGIGEAAQYRKAMGSAIIGGLVISTMITLLVVPAVFEYIDRLREFIEKRFRPDDFNIQISEITHGEHSIIMDEFFVNNENVTDGELIKTQDKKFIDLKTKKNKLKKRKDINKKRIY